jgi:hypothetical protein
MRLPHKDAHFSHRTRFGRYVERRLRRDKRLQIANDVCAATADVRTLGRALEDAVDPVQDALADRDATDDGLDTTAQNGRLALASRSLDAVKKAPYTLIFPAGIAYYTAARLEDQDARYNELKSRLAEHLPANDEVRTTAIAAIDTDLLAFKTASATLTSARTEEAMAKTRLDAAEEAWERLMNKVYGILFSELGRKQAEQFFPKVRNGSKKDDDGTD